MSDTEKNKGKPSAREPIPWHLYRYVATVEHTARQNLLSTGTLPEMAFIVNVENNEIFPVAVNRSTDLAFERSAENIRAKAADMKADMVILASVGWTLKEKHLSRHREIIEEYGSIVASPYRREIVMMTVESTAGRWMGQSTILPCTGVKKKTFGEVLWQHGVTSQGPTSQLLP